MAKRARDEDEEDRVSAAKRAPDALPDALRLNCTDAVAAATGHLMRVLASLKNLQTVHCAAEGARARVTVPRPVGLLPMQLAPVLAVLGAHRATCTVFSAAEPNVLLVDDAPAFDEPPQVAAWRLNAPLMFARDPTGGTPVGASPADVLAPRRRRGPYAPYSPGHAPAGIHRLFHGATYRDVRDGLLRPYDALPPFDDVHARGIARVLTLVLARLGFAATVRPRPVAPAPPAPAKRARPPDDSDSDNES